MRLDMPEPGTSRYADRRKAEPWSEADEAQLRQLVADKVHRQDIAALLRRTRGSVDARMSKLGILPKRARSRGPADE
jgi:hypothetical protein